MWYGKEQRQLHAILLSAAISKDFLLCANCSLAVDWLICLVVWLSVFVRQFLSTTLGRIILAFLHGVFWMWLWLNVGLPENFVKGIRLLHAQETNPKNEKQGKDSKEDAPNSHCKQEKSHQQIHHVASSKGEEQLSKGRCFYAWHQNSRSLHRDKEHPHADKAYYRTHQDVEIMRLDGKPESHYRISLLKLVKRVKSSQVKSSLDNENRVRKVYRWTFLRGLETWLDLGYQVVSTALALLASAVIPRG